MKELLRFLFSRVDLTFVFVFIFSESRLSPYLFALLEKSLRSRRAVVDDTRYLLRGGGGGAVVHRCNKPLAE